MYFYSGQPMQFLSGVDKFLREFDRERESVNNVRAIKR